MIFVPRRQGRELFDFRLILLGGKGVPSHRGGKIFLRRVKMGNSPAFSLENG